jgi:hypothetical protein
VEGRKEGRKTLYIKEARMEPIQRNTRQIKAQQHMSQA